MDDLICLRRMRMQNSRDRRYNDCCNPEGNELFLTIADGDFAFSKIIEEQVIKSVQTRSLAYSFLEDETKLEIVKYYQKHYNLSVNPDHMLFGNGVLYWIQILIKAFTNKGDQVLSLAPVYDSFSDIVKDAGRIDLKSHLIFNNNKFDIDFKDLEAKMQQAKLFILCSPHNPTGNVWSGDELTKMLDLAQKYNVIVAADEIWQDIILKNQFVSTLSFKKYADTCVHISSPAKTFNLGGIQMGLCVLTDDTLLQKVKQEHIATIHYSSSNHWTSSALKVAYGNEQVWTWFTKYIAQIKKNVAKLEAFLDQNGITYAKPEATYLVFVKMGDIAPEVFEPILLKYGLHLGQGLAYGPEYQSWVRINIAICDNSMNLLLENLAKVFADIKKTS